MSSYRTCRLEHRYSQAFRQLAQTEPRAEDAQTGLEWTLCRHPEWGYSVKNTKLRLWPLQVGTQRLAAYYFFDASVVTLVALRVVPADPAWMENL